ncbi:MAG TPA: hypothetical protein VM662_06285, partial [Sphingomonas sp.]|nr:hypothetical protein [Sphingomonas sp.]
MLLPMHRISAGPVDRNTMNMVLAGPQTRLRNGPDGPTDAPGVPVRAGRTCWGGRIGRMQNSGIAGENPQHGAPWRILLTEDDAPVRARLQTIIEQW